MIELRMANPEDINGIYSVTAETMAELGRDFPEMNRYILQRLIFDDRSLNAVVLYEDGAIAGCCLFEQHTEFPDCRTYYGVKFIGVISGLRRRKLATAMLLYLLQRAGDNGIAGITWQTDVPSPYDEVFCRRFDDMFASMSAPHCC